MTAIACALVQAKAPDAGPFHGRYWARTSDSQLVDSEHGSDTNAHTSGVDEERAPICPTCGVTMVPAALSADDDPEGDWVCVECEELDADEVQ